MSARSHCAICGVDCHDCEHALSHEQGRALGLDADTAVLCLGCLREAAYLTALLECARAAWRLWGRRRATETCHRYQSTLDGLVSRRANVDGFVALTEVSS